MAVLDEGRTAGAARAAWAVVTRGGAINSSLLVRLLIGGSAPASHYNSVSTFLNFGPQQTTALVAISPKSTAVLSNGLEFVQITIKPDATYRVMSPSSDRVLLVDQIMTFALWQQKYFPGSTEDPTVFAMQDPGNTGIRNLFRYAYGLDALNPQGAGKTPSAWVVDDHLTLSFVRPPAISDLDYVVEVSDDLRNWRTGGDQVQRYLPASSSNDVQTVFYRTTTQVSTTPELFLRVRVEPR